MVVLVIFSIDLTMLVGSIYNYFDNLNIIVVTLSVAFMGLFLFLNFQHPYFSFMDFYNIIMNVFCRYRNYLSFVYKFVYF